jgi:hypothetical protein
MIRLRQLDGYVWSLFCTLGAVFFADFFETFGIALSFFATPNLLCNLIEDREGGGIPGVGGAFWEQMAVCSRIAIPSHHSGSFKFHATKPLRIPADIRSSQSHPKCSPSSPPYVKK